MQYNAVMQHTMTATVYRFTDTQDELSLERVRTFYPDGEIELTMVARSDRKAVIYTKTALKPFERIVDIKDRAGKEIISTDYRVDAYTPVVNPMGFSDGFSYQVSKVFNDGTPEVVNANG